MGATCQRGREVLLRPLTEGLNVPRDLDLGDRGKALEQLKVNRLAHAAIVGVGKLVADALTAACHTRRPPGPVIFHSDRGYRIHQQ